MPHHKKVLQPKGYTLIELCLVTALILLLCSYTAPLLLRVPDSIVRYEIMRLRRVISYLQKKAVLYQKSLTLTFSQDGRSYTSDQTWYFPEDVMLDDREKLSGPPSHLRSRIEQTITWKHRKIAISAQGALSAGALYLTDRSYKATYALTTDASEIRSIRVYVWKDGWRLID